MLSLKHNHGSAAKHKPSTTLTDLPDELLHIILTYLHELTGGITRDLLPLSVVSVRFNQLLRPWLFKTIRIHLTQRYVDKRTFNILINCCLYPHTFARYIRDVVQDDSYRFREHGCEDLRLTNELTVQIVQQAISKMVGLTTISTDCMNSPILHFARMRFPDKPFHLKISPCRCADIDGKVQTEVSRLLTSNTNHSLSVITRKHEGLRATHLWSTEGTKKRFKALYNADLTSPRVYATSSPSAVFASASMLRQLEELHLDVSDATLSTGLNEMRDALPSLPMLQRLAVNGSGMCDIILRIAGQLERLESLRLNSEVTTIFHAHLRNHVFEGLPYQKLPHIKRLEIRYISRYLSIEHVVPKGLTHLRIEYQNRGERLTPYHLRWIAEVCPDLECLELDIGALTNLWHPTAVAGVDIDMDVYRMLDALSKFTKLKRLRLFPSYWQSRAGYLYFTQPLEDLQAVKIFDHVRRVCRSLQMLIISNSQYDYMARTEFSARGLSEPVKWIVRATGSSGKRMLLTTHEAMRNYHLEQVWEGARRLTMNTVRHNTWRPHFDDLQNWTISPFEFYFDEPRPCHWEMTSSTNPSTSDNFPP